MFVSRVLSYSKQNTLFKTLENQDVDNDEGKRPKWQQLKHLSFAKVLNLKFQQQPHWTLTYDPNTTLGHCYGWVWTHTNTDTLRAYTFTGGTSTCPGEHSLFFSDGYHKQTVLPSLSQNSHPLAQPGQVVLRHPWQMVLKCRGQQVRGYLLESPKT